MCARSAAKIKGWLILWCANRKLTLLDYSLVYVGGRYWQEIDGRRHEIYGGLSCRAGCIRCNEKEQLVAYLLSPSLSPSPSLTHTHTRARARKPSSRTRALKLTSLIRLHLLRVGFVFFLHLASRGGVVLDGTRIRARRHTRRY